LSSGFSRTSKGFGRFSHYVRQNQLVGIGLEVLDAQARIPAHHIVMKAEQQAGGP
jgi:hypothetical protein